MRPVYMLSGGITKFAKAHPDKDFRLMVKEALDDTRRAGFKIQPACSFVVAYVRRHPEYLD